MQKFQNLHAEHEKSTRIISDYVEEQPDNYLDVTDEISAPTTQHKDTTLDEAVRRFVRDIGVATLSANAAKQAHTVSSAEISITNDIEMFKQALLSWRDKAVVEARIDELNNVVIATDIDDIGRSMSAYIQKRKAQLKETPNED